MYNSSQRNQYYYNGNSDNNSGSYRVDRSSDYVNYEPQVVNRNYSQRGQEYTPNIQTQGLNDTYGGNHSYNRSNRDQICQDFLRGACTKGLKCEFKHTTNFREKAVVCKHWLRGLCKKGDQCEFLHEFNMRKMPECWFYSRYGECSNEDCMYLHIDPESKIKECAWYARGFCKHGPHCRHKHVRKVVCQLYLSGFCPKGLECPNGHPKYELPTAQREHDGHEEEGSHHNTFRSLAEVTCFKCGEKGHFANRCPKGQGNRY
ncbi:14119_t:CDS:2 [Cetraspora pellucida]|uniref:mRNA 3'-end-processing protein n=1 Tax=Cetraspora pellucida TaxID=1433469 RepID=A0A9N8W246_9GLOM|nr:14119_t:CDS:2 [Cetraspora pellucida]